MSTHHDQALLDALGQRIAELRRAQGLSQAQLAEQIGVDNQTVQRAERARVSLSLSRVGAIANALGVPVATLFEDRGSPVGGQEVAPEELSLLQAWRAIQHSHLRSLAVRVIGEFGSTVISPPEGEGAACEPQTPSR